MKPPSSLNLPEEDFQYYKYYRHDKIERERRDYEKRREMWKQRRQQRQQNRNNQNQWRSFQPGVYQQPPPGMYQQQPWHQNQYPQHGGYNNQPSARFPPPPTFNQP